MSFASQVGSARKPPRIVTLGPDAYADTYDLKPSHEVAIGLRLLSERDIDTARGQAVKRIADTYVDDAGNCTDEQARDEAYNDALMCWAVARATCQVNDITRPFFEMAEDVVSVALTPDTIRYLWDELVILQRGKGSTMTPATDEEIAELVVMLGGDTLSLIHQSNQVELRKLLAHVHGVLSAAGGLNG